MAIKIDLTPKDLKTLQELLQQYLPHTLVWAFGSRVKFTAQPNSDLDLVAFIGKDQELKFSLLKDALQESNIPFRIDLHNWDELPQTFHKNIESAFVEIQSNEKQVMPSEWKTYKLSELVEIKYGKDHKHLTDGNIPLYGSGGIMRYVDTPLYEQESILIPRKGTLSNLFYLNIPFWSVDTMFYTKIKEGNNGKYLYYLLKSMDLASMNVGSAVPSLTTEVLNKVEINVPDEDTQIEIAQILTSLDDKIELNLQMNQTLEAMAQAIFKEWFVDFKFPGFDGKLVDGLPKDWTYKTIKALGKVVTGNTPSSKNPEHFGEVIPFVTPTDFKNFGKLIIGANRYLSYEGKLAMKTRLLPIHSIIVTCIGSDMGKIAMNSVECVTNQQINSIVPNQENIKDYLYYDLVYKYEYLRNIATGGSTMPIINKSRFEEIEILVPNSNTLEIFQTLMNNFNSKIEENIRQLQSLTNTRDTLLPKLMSGKIEIKN